MLRLPIDTPRLPTDIVEEVQRTSKMLEYLAINVAEVASKEDNHALQD